MFLNGQENQTEGLSEAAKQRELQRKIEQLRAEISHLDSQISGTEEQLATQGWCGNHFILRYSFSGYCDQRAETSSFAAIYFIFIYI